MSDVKIEVLRLLLRGGTRGSRAGREVAEAVVRELPAHIHAAVARSRPAAADVPAVSVHVSSADRAASAVGAAIAHRLGHDAHGGGA